MKPITSTPRIHPLIAAAAASVVIASLVGTAAIAGLLPSSVGATAAPLAAAALAPTTLTTTTVPQQLAMTALPLVKHRAPRAVHHAALARNDYQTRDNTPVVQQPQQAAQPAAPNYVEIGVGAVVGGLLGNQVGDGNGRKLATLAGMIGGGMLGNEVANRNR